jgi:putative FmdB family regulatory protein
MPTYEYECRKCGLKFERHQNMTDEPLQECPACGGQVQRMISGGIGFIMKQSGARMREAAKSCSFEETGTTCCGAKQRCGQSPCGD